MRESIKLNERILIVDDENTNLFLLEKMLSGFEVATATNEKDMLAKLEQFNPSVILLDVMLPGKDGFSIAEELSANEKYCNIPIIFLTAKSSATDVVTGFDVGGSDYIKKPFHEDELIARIKAVLKKTKEVSYLKEVSTIDHITDFFNRRYLERFIAVEESKFRRKKMMFSAAMIDIDFFKNINDSCGHQCGDFILKEFAMVIRKTLRSHDTAFRYGGEEFLVISPDASRYDVFNLIDRIRKNHSVRDYVFKGKKIVFSFTCGIADLSDVKKKSDMFSEMIRIADMRLYRGKESGRNMTVVDDK